MFVKDQEHKQGRKQGTDIIEYIASSNAYLSNGVAEQDKRCYRSK